jgi:hypothetical protein
MAQQSRREFASAKPTKGAQDARVQERGIRARISLQRNTKKIRSFFAKETLRYAA